VLVTKNKVELCIIIPAYNEAKKLDVSRYHDFLSQHQNIAFVLVDDGSTDQTSSMLSAIQSAFPNACFFIKNNANIGKAESVRKGIQWALANLDTEKIAFLDADLSTSFEECYRVAQTIQGNIRFSFGSRILTVDSHIERKAFRHYIGRVIATAISTMLKLKVYDTQCGCKAFEISLAKVLFEDPFISKWLFDVELFFRALKHLGRENATIFLHEEPLREWIDRGKSSVKLSYFWVLWLDLLKIKLRYKDI